MAGLHDHREPSRVIMESRHPVSLAQALRAAERTLQGAGVASPRADAEQIAAHLMRCGRGEVLAASLRGTPAPDGFEAMVAARATRVPLQHLTGRAAFRHVELDVGPGVFVPRPETELVAGAAIDAASRVLAEGGAPVVVDLCTGSGAIAAAVADEVPGAKVHACELDPMAHAWAWRNLARAGVDLRLADAADAFPDLDGTVDVVVSNPPYIPPGCVPQDPEVREHDPEVALYGGGEDGLAVPRLVMVTAARLLRAGGVLVMEHADTQQQPLLSWLRGGPWCQVEGHRDLADRPRFVTAVRVAEETASRSKFRADSPSLTPAELALSRAGRLWAERATRPNFLPTVGRHVIARGVGEVRDRGSRSNSAQTSVSDCCVIAGADGACACEVRAISCRGGAGNGDEHPGCEGC